MSPNVEINKNNIEFYLKELAKEYKKQGGKTKIEIIIIGGASVIINYNFRYSSFDIDCDIDDVGSIIKDCINSIRDRNNLQDDWLNEDFKNTASYSYKIKQYSKYYKTFNLIEYRTITSEYLIAMKMKSGRMYKRDKSDIIGIIIEEKEKGNVLTIDKINQAIIDLYGSLEGIDDNIKQFVKDIFKTKDLKDLYNKTMIDENQIKQGLIDFEKKYPNELKVDNLNDIINKLQKK